MSVALLVKGALQRYAAEETFLALHDVCSAIEATAKAEGYPAGRGGYKSWLDDATPLIFLISTQGLVTLREKKGFSIAYQDPSKGEVMLTLAELVYHVFRCGLYHNASLPTGVEFNDVQAFMGGGSNRQMSLPRELGNVCKTPFVQCSQLAHEAGFS